MRRGFKGPTRGEEGSARRAVRALGRRVALLALVAAPSAGCDGNFLMASGTVAPIDDTELFLVDAGAVTDASDTFPRPRYDAPYVEPSCTSSGTLDVSFGDQGFVAPLFATTPAAASAVAVDPTTSKIVVVGAARKGDAWAWAIVRLLSDGTRDMGFGGGGIVLTSFSQGEGELTAVTLQPDGKIVVAGEIRASGGQQTCAVARYTLDGTPDPAFGTAGFVRFSQGSSCALTAVRLDHERRITVAGTSFSEDDTRSDFVIARLLHDGSFDESFGSEGIARANITGGFDNLRDMVVLPNGSLLAVGDGGDGGKGATSYVTARFLADGHLDPNFGSGGTVISTEGLGAAGVALRDPTGAYYVAGYPPLALHRMLENGAHDATFGSLGRVEITMKEYPVLTGERIVLQPDGKIVVAGTARSSSESAFALARFASTGLLDPTFGAGGLATLKAMGRDVQTRGIDLQPDGRLVIVGTLGSGDDMNFGIARVCP